MSLRRYNRLRKLGYRTVKGTNWDDPWSGDEWVELFMTNGTKMKKVIVKGGMVVREFMEPESNCSEKANSSQTNGDLVGGVK